MVSTVAQAQNSPSEMYIHFQQWTVEDGAPTNLTQADWDARSSTEQQQVIAQCLAQTGLPDRQGNCSPLPPRDYAPGSNGSDVVGGSGGNGGWLFGSQTISLMLFNYAVKSDSCMSCTFLSFFMIAISDFSYLVFQYFYNAFIVLAPVTIAVWLAYRAAKLMIMGGEDGKDFLYGVVGKFALFSVIWIFATAANSNRDHLWEMTGPVYLKFAFDIADEVKDHALGISNSANTTQMSTNDESLLCTQLDVTQSLGGMNIGDTKYSFIESAVKTGCFTERSHMLGISSGAAVAFDSHDMTANLSIWKVAEVLTKTISIVIKFLIGLLVAASFAISAIWLVFLILDVVVRIMVTAAFSPLLILSYIYKPTRNVAVEAFKGVIGATCTAVAITIINVMAYVLITNTPLVFTMTYQDIAAGIDSWDVGSGGGGPEDPIDKVCGGQTPGFNVETDRVNAAHNFVCFVGIGNISEARIPMNFATPWFWYLVFVGVSIFALGRKLIKMIEGIVGYQGAAEMANSALKSVKMGTTVAAVGATGGAMAGLGIVAGGGMAGAYASGAVGKAAGATATKAGQGLKWVAGRMNGNNVLAASNIGNRVNDSLNE